MRCLTACQTMQVLQSPAPCANFDSHCTKVLRRFICFSPKNGRCETKKEREYVIASGAAPCAPAKAGVKTREDAWKSSGNPRKAQEGKQKRRCRCGNKATKPRVGSVLAARALAAKILVAKVRATALRNRDFQALLRNGKRPATDSFSLFWRLRVFAARFFVSSCRVCPCRGWMVSPFRRLQ